jgi:hypothetical protein
MLRRTRQSMGASAAEALRDYLTTGRFREGHWERGDWEVFDKARPGDPRLRADWSSAREGLLARWICDRPGTRPFAWWQFDAPRWARQDLPLWCRDEGNPALEALAEPRRRIGGVGTERYRVLGGFPEFNAGLPREFVTAADLQVFESAEGRAIYARGVGSLLGEFVGVPIDPNDPPLFESEADYLRRHNLFLAGEERRLTAADFAPYTVTV